MGPTDTLISRLAGKAFLSATLMLSGLLTPALAADHMHTCVTNPGNMETATVVFHPRLLGIDGNEGDGDVITDDFEHRFGYWFDVHQYDTAAKTTGGELCSDGGGWSKSWDMPKLRPQYMTVDPGGIVYIENVPRHSKVRLRFWAAEEDSGDDDQVDFDPAPNKDQAEVYIFMDERNAQTMVGMREGRYDLTLNQTKRLVGDGSVQFSGDSVRGFIEFVANVHPAAWPANPGFSANLPSPGQPVGGATVIAPGPVQIVKEPTCRAYALQAVEFNVEAQKLGCGFGSPVWSNDHETHYQWCMRGNNIAMTNSEQVKRAAALDQCANEKSAAALGNLALCAIYATEASVSARRAVDWGCGLSGPRWSTDYGAHLAWCVAGAPAPVMLSEAAARGAELAACATATGN